MHQALQRQVRRRRPVVLPRFRQRRGPRAVDRDPLIKIQFEPFLNCSFPHPSRWRGNKRNEFGDIDHRAGLAKFFASYVVNSLIATIRQVYVARIGSDFSSEASDTRARLADGSGVCISCFAFNRQNFV